MELLKTNGERFPSGLEDVQAFPQTFVKPGQVAGTRELVIIPGMTLRDYLAAKALPALIDRYVFQGSDISTVKFIATAAYEIADEMLVERIKPGKS